MHKWIIAAILTTLCGGLVASEPTEVEPLKPLDFNDFRQVEHGGGAVDGWRGITFGLSWDKTIHGQGQAMDWISLNGGLPFSEYFGQVVRVGWGAGGEIDAPNKTGQRDRDTDVFGYYFESGLRGMVSIGGIYASAYAEVGLSYAYMTRVDTTGTSDNFGAYASIGIEGGFPYVRMYIETGIRGLMPIAYSDTEIRDTNSFHWLGIRVGVRVVVE